MVCRRVRHSMPARYLAARLRSIVCRRRLANSLVRVLSYLRGEVMMRVIRFPPLLVALMVCVAVSGCNKKTGKKPKIELGIHELTVAQGATEVIGANRTVVKVQGDHSGLSVMPQEWGGDIHITATKDAKEGSYDFIFSDEDGNTDTLKVTVTKAEPSAGSSSASQGSSNKHKIAEFPSGVSDWKPDQ